MLIALHKNARTTPAIRAEIASSALSAGALARQFGVSVATASKWKKNPSAHDLSHTAHRLQTTPTSMKHQPLARHPSGNLVFDFRRRHARHPEGGEYVPTQASSYWRRRRPGELGRASGGACAAGRKAAFQHGQWQRYTHIAALRRHDERKIGAIRSSVGAILGFKNGNLSHGFRIL